LQQNIGKIQKQRQPMNEIDLSKREIIQKIELLRARVNALGQDVN
jgi:hypothetical protein